MMDGKGEERRFLDLLPWHVNGTLEQSERSWVERYVAAHSDAVAELRWTEALQARIREAAAIEATPDVGFARFQARIHAKDRRRPEGAHDEGHRGERLRRFIARWRPTPTMALATTLILAQAAVIATLLPLRSDEPDQEFSSVRSLAPAQAVRGPVLRVSFRADTPERELRALIVSVGGSLVGGPGQLGSYVVIVPSQRLEQAYRQLAASRVVEDVEVLANVPARE